MKLWIAALIAASLAATVATARSQQSATVRVVPAQDSFADGEDVLVEIRVEDVTNLGAFQTVVTFDPDRLEFQSVGQGTWLGSSGREVICPEPTVDAAAVQLRCVTLRDAPPGVSGSGTLSHLVFRAKSSGTSAVNVSRARLLSPDGTEIPSTVNAEEVLIVVEGGGAGRAGLLVGLAIVSAGVLVVFIARRFLRQRMRP